MFEKRDDNKNKFKHNLLKIVVIPTLFFILAIGVTHFQFKNLKKIQNEHENQIKIKLALSEYIRSLTDAETSLGGYFATQNEIFLNPYYNTITNKLKAEDLVRSLVAFDSELNSKFSKLVKLADDWFKDFSLDSTDKIKYMNSLDANANSSSRNKFDLITVHFKNLNKDIDANINNLSDQFRKGNSSILITEIFMVFMFIIFLYLILNKLVKNLVFSYKDLLEKNEDQCLKIEEALRSKDLFLANMSHEIRTPLGAVLGFVDLALEDKSLSSQTQSYLSFVKRNGTHLLDLVEDLFDLSKVGSQKVEIIEEPCNMIELLSDIKNTFSSKVNDKSQKLNFNILGQIPVKVITDPVRLKQILTNLIGNSIKFTERDRVIEFSVSAQKEHLVFDIIDQGIGIPTHKHDIIFSAFEQGEDDHSRKYGGAGLGLSISKNFAELMGGTLSLVSSDSESGSHFRLSIPKKVENSNEFSQIDLDRLESSFYVNKGDVNKPLQNQSLEKVKVLLAEDAKENQILYKIYLESAGAEVDVVENGKDAVEASRRNDYDIVIMDIQMPGLNGYEAIKKLKLEKFDKKTMALTAHAMKGEKEKCIKLGFDGYLSKPVSRAVLIDYISKLISTN